MEKIYIEENQKKKKNNHLSVSVGLSFGVAFIAIVSILFVSMSGTTYSLPTVDTLPTKITTLAPTHVIKPTAPAASMGIENFSVEPYSAQGISHPVYCVESAMGYTPAELSRDGEITDEGFIYLLTKIENLDVGTVTPSGSVTADQAKSFVKSWLGQTAIWMYLGSTGAANSKSVFDGDDEPPVPNIYIDSNINALTNINALQVNDADLNTLGNITSSTSFYKQTGLDAILTKAIQNHNKSDVLNATITKSSDKFVLTSNNYLKSDKVTVKIGTSGLISDIDDNYSIVLNNVPTGTKVYGINANGKEEEIKDLTKVSYSKYQQFYLYVPADKVTGTVNFTASIKAAFEVYTGYFYKAAGAQRVTTVDKVAKMKNPGVPFTITRTPDTASNASSIMYIVGMIVLLSGLGILYVNIKNQKQYQ